MVAHLHLFHSELPIGETLRKILTDKIKYLPRIGEFKGIHKAVTGSILELLNEKFTKECEKYKPRYTLKEFFKVILLQFSTFSTTEL